MRKRNIMLIGLLTVLIATGCGQRNVNINETAMSSEPIESTTDTFSEEKESAASEGVSENSEEESPETTEQPELLLAERLEMLFGPDKDDIYADVKAKLLGAKQIETKYIIWDVAKDAALTQADMDRVDALCEVLELVTGKTFLGGKYSPDKKVTIHLSKHVAQGYADEEEKSISLDVSCLTKENFVVTVHELVHILAYADCMYLAYPFYMEGYAEYWTYRVGEYVRQNDYQQLSVLLDLEAREAMWSRILGGVSFESIFEQDVFYWMDRGCYFEFADSWPAYVYGRCFFAYLDDVYGDSSAWLQAAAKVQNIAWADDEPGKDDRYFFMDEDMRKIMTTVYDETVFDNFYSWLEGHGDLYKEYRQ